MEISHDDNHYTSTGEGTKYGVAFGELSLPVDRPKIQCKILIEGEKQIMNQIATRIDDEIITILRKKYGQDKWAFELLKHNGDYDELL